LIRFSIWSCGSRKLDAVEILDFFKAAPTLWEEVAGRGSGYFPAISLFLARLLN
jgi:hypothetical protein